MKFGEIMPKVLKTLRSPVGRMTSHPDVNLVAPPFHRPLVRSFVRSFAVIFWPSTSGCDGSYQFLRAAGAPVRRRGAAGAPAARKN